MITYDYGPWQKMSLVFSTSQSTHQPIIGIIWKGIENKESNIELFYKHTVLSLLEHCCASGPFSQKEAKNTGHSSEKGKKDPSYRTVSIVTYRNL